MDHQSAARCGIAWHPDGTLLAVPGTEHDVVCYERDEWKPVSYLTGQHTARVNLVTYSPNGESNAEDLEFRLSGGWTDRVCGWAGRVIVPINLEIL